jgi:hypothetical protein
VPPPSAQGGAASTATPLVVQGIATVLAPNAFGEFRAFPAVVASFVAVGAPVLIGDAVAVPVVVVGLGSVPPPADVGQIRGEWPQTNGGGWGSAAGLEWPQTSDIDEWELVP